MALKCNLVITMPSDVSVPSAGGSGGYARRRDRAIYGQLKRKNNTAEGV